MDTPKLKPCELKPCKCGDCGHPARVCEDWGLGYYVECSLDFCDNATEYFDTPEEAVAAWNHRNGEETKDAKTEA